MRLVFSNSLPKQTDIIFGNAVSCTGEGRGDSDWQTSCHGRSWADPSAPQHPLGQGWELHLLGEKPRLSAFIWGSPEPESEPRMWVLKLIWKVTLRSPSKGVGK